MRYQVIADERNQQNQKADVKVGNSIGSWKQKLNLVEDGGWWANKKPHEKYQMKSCHLVSGVWQKTENKIV